MQTNSDFSKSTTATNFMSGGVFQMQPDSFFHFPLVSAKAWSVVEPKRGDLLWGKMELDKLRIASLTKIMTCHIVIKTLHRLKMDPKHFSIQVSKRASLVPGTSARLQAGDTFTALDLLYGLMLPSGNDAALALAQNFGLSLFQLHHKQKHKLHKGRPPVCTDDPLYIFIKEMNNTSRKMNLKSTWFTNPHGLSDPGSYSTAADVGKMAAHAMKDPLLREIVSRIQYKCMAQTKDGFEREYIWENTNTLLKGTELSMLIPGGFNGIKTGITPTAGPCLSVSHPSSGLIITVLGCKSLEARFTEVVRVTQWALARLQDSRVAGYSLPKKGARSSILP